MQSALISAHVECYGNRGGEARCSSGVRPAEFIALLLTPHASCDNLLLMFKKLREHFIQLHNDYAKDYI